MCFSELECFGEVINYLRSINHTLTNHPSENLSLIKPIIYIHSFLFFIILLILIGWIVKSCRERWRDPAVGEEGLEGLIEA